MKRVPNRDDETESAEQYKQGPVRQYHPFWNYPRESGLGAKTAGQSKKTSTHPCSVCALRREHCAIGSENSASFGAVLNLHSAALYRLAAAPEPLTAPSPGFGH